MKRRLGSMVVAGTVLTALVGAHAQDVDRGRSRIASFRQAAAYAHGRWLEQPTLRRAAAVAWCMSLPVLPFNSERWI